MDFRKELAYELINNCIEREEEAEEESNQYGTRSKTEQEMITCPPPTTQYVGGRTLKKNFQKKVSTKVLYDTKMQKKVSHLL